MAKHPGLSRAAESLPLSIFARLVERLSAFRGDVIPFHIGDTYLPPPEAGRLGSLGFSCDHEPELYAYSPPHGDSALIEALVDKVRRDNGMHHVGADCVQVVSGATHALSCAVRAVLDPGDEILLLAPYWPLIRGISLSCCVCPVEVPLSHRLAAGEPVDVAAAIERRVTPKTRALYLCTPNNPDGKVFDHDELRAIASVALRHDLWVLSDEVYERFVYDGRAHQSIAALPGMADRTLTAFSFSKSYAQAGLRVGYLVGSAPVIAAARKMSNHTIYSVSRAMQRAALAALSGGEAFLAEARERYQHARDVALAQVAVPTFTPQGSTYLFLDLGRWIEEGQDALCLLERMAEAGLLLAPGAAFGHDFGAWARLCFTSVPEERLREGIDRFNAVLERAARG